MVCPLEDAFYFLVPRISACGRFGCTCTCTVYLDSCSLLHHHNKVCQATDKVTVNCLDISIQSANFTSGGSSKLIN